MTSRGLAPSRAAAAELASRRSWPGGEGAEAAAAEARGGARAEGGRRDDAEAREAHRPKKEQRLWPMEGAAARVPAPRAAIAIGAEPSLPESLSVYVETRLEESRSGGRRASY